MNSHIEDILRSYGKYESLTPLSNYRFKRSLSGGKSGAIIILAESLVDNKERIIKYYSNSYDVFASGETKKQNTIESTRPFREVITLCLLSNIKGFSQWFEYGFTTILPSINGIDKVSYGLYVVMDKAEGIPLSNLKFHELSRSQTIAIAVHLIGIVKKCREVLGDDFRHWDLHPDNIFVDFSQVYKIDVHIENIHLLGKSPALTIIDFDLASFAKLDSFFKSPIEVEHTNKINSSIIVPERTLALVFKLIPIGQVFSLLNVVKNIGDLDIRNWLIISKAILTYVKSGDIVEICNSLVDCISRNSKLLDLYRSNTTSSSINKWNDDTNIFAESITVHPITTLFPKSFLTTYKAFELQVYNSTKYFPNQDTLRFNFSLVSKEKVAFTFGDAFTCYLYRDIPIKTTLSFQQMIPTISTTFRDGMHIKLHASSILKTKLKDIIIKLLNSSLVNDSILQQLYCVGVFNIKATSYDITVTTFTLHSVVVNITTTHIIVICVISECNALLEMLQSIVHMFEKQQNGTYRFILNIPIRNEKNACFEMLTGVSKDNQQRNKYHKECITTINNLLLTYSMLLGITPENQQFWNKNFTGSVFLECEGIMMQVKLKDIRKEAYNAIIQAIISKYSMSAISYAANEHHIMPGELISSLIGSIFGIHN